jgi:hypothetical protein
MSGIVFLTLGRSLLLTLILETLFLWLSGHGHGNTGICILVNLLTNPPVVLAALLASRFCGGSAMAAQMFLELLAVFAEGLCYRRLGRAMPRPMLFSFCINAFSYGVGRFLIYFL